MAALQDSWSKYQTTEGIRNLPETGPLQPRSVVRRALRGAGGDRAAAAGPCALARSMRLARRRRARRGARSRDRRPSRGSGRSSCPCLARGGCDHRFSPPSARRWPSPCGSIAWLTGGLLAQAASVALIALAAVTIAELAAAFAPEWSLVVGLVVLAVVDVVLVWGTAQVQPASTALHAATVGHGIPELQDATFGGATMGWLDLLAPALLGVVAHARLRARGRHRARRRRLGVAAARHSDGSGDGARARRSPRRSPWAMQVAVLSDIHANLTRSRPCSPRSTTIRRTSSGASATSSATGRGRTSAVRSCRRARRAASPGTTTSPCGERST